jgi:hypothetical protein
LPEHGRVEAGSVPTLETTVFLQPINQEGSTVAEFTFFVDTDTYDHIGGELFATWDDLIEQGVRHVDLPREYPHDLAHRVPVRVTGTARGLRFYARLLHLRDPLQLEELDRVCDAAASDDD